MELTDWFENCVPVRPGTYDIIEARTGIQGDAVSQAEWGTRFGTTGFWRVSELKQEGSNVPSRHYALIAVRAWRGQTRGFLRVPLKQNVHQERRAVLKRRPIQQELML